MNYCFLKEDLIDLEDNNPLIIQMKYAKKINKLFIGDLEKQTISYVGKNINDFNGSKVLLRCTYTNLHKGISLLEKYNAIIVETASDIDHIENWYKLSLTKRNILETTISNLNKEDPEKSFLLSHPKVFIKSKQKGFTAMISSNKLLQNDIDIYTFLNNQCKNPNDKLLLTCLQCIKTDSLGKRETRHIIINNNLVNSSRRLFNLYHTVPKSHITKANELRKLIATKTKFPSSYVLDLADFIDESCERYIDIVEINPLSCSTCFVNNSIFECKLDEINKIYNQTRFGYEYCLDLISNPKNYTFSRNSNRIYTCVNENDNSFI